MKPEIKKENVKPLFESRFIRVFDLQYEEGKHYLDATRRTADNLMAIKTTEEFKQALPDAVTCVVILNIEGKEPKLLLDYEYRYPAGQFLLSPPAGLLDKEDAETNQPILSAAKREIEEETGLKPLPLDEKVFSIWNCGVRPHIKRGKFVSAHLHLDFDYLFGPDHLSGSGHP